MAALSTSVSSPSSPHNHGHVIRFSPRPPAPSPWQGGGSPHDGGRVSWRGARSPHHRRGQPAISLHVAPLLSSSPFSRSCISGS
ncbi:hypothetical protein U9M48_029798 [Paspalum notatum var. saurae]|uniref:Uncharacterized protein n=1 Tax=Paspalum notatum var. saurae TaxID=547442 RepID=A0AAQ3TYM9_PASNO